jgi:hypothetical protein
MATVTDILAAHRPDPRVTIGDGPGPVRIELTLLDAQLVLKDYAKGNGPALAEMMLGVMDALDELRQECE